MNTSGSSESLGTARRGYRRVQVEERLAALVAECDAAQERAAHLSVVAGELEGKLTRLREEVRALSPMEFQALGERAQAMLYYVEEEASGLRQEADDAADTAREQARQVADELARQAREQARRVRNAAEESAAGVIAAAERQASALRGEAGREAASARAEADERAEAVRQKAQRLVSNLERSHEERFGKVETELRARENEVDSRLGGLLQRAEAMLADAQRAHTEAFEAGRRSDVRARARADELLAKAALEAERIDREAARELREHDRTRKLIRYHLAQVRRSLAAVTGRSVVDDYEDEEGYGESRETETSELLGERQTAERTARSLEDQPRGTTRMRG